MSEPGSPRRLDKADDLCLSPEPIEHNFSESEQTSLVRKKSMMFELASNGPVVARISLILYILPLVYSMDNILSEWTIVGGRTLNGLGSEVSMTGSTCALGQNGGSFISDEEDKGLFTGGAGKQFVTTDASLIPKVSIANAIYPYTGEFAASKPVHAWAGVPGLEEASVGVLVGSSFVSKAWVDLNTAEKVQQNPHICYSYNSDYWGWEGRGVPAIHFPLQSHASQRDNSNPL